MFTAHCRSFATQDIFTAETQEPRLKKMIIFLTEGATCHALLGWYLSESWEGVQLYSILARKVSKLIRYNGQQFEWNISLVFFNATDVYAQVLQPQLHAFLDHIHWDTRPCHQRSLLWKSHQPHHPENQYKWSQWHTTCGLEYQQF